MIELAAFLGALVATLTLGIPIARQLAQPHLFLERKESTVLLKEGHTSAGFKPLDLGPDKMQWPSERPWDLKTTLQTPDWPSKAWNDEHFGTHWKKANPGSGSPPATNADPNAATPPRPKPRKRKAPAPEAAPAQPSLVDVVAAKEFFQEASAGSGPPTAEELESLVSTLGLAATVQAIMDRTGWDFRQAAQHLASVRKR